MQATTLAPRLTLPASCVGCSAASRWTARSRQTRSCCTRCCGRCPTPWTPRHWPASSQPRRSQSCAPHSGAGWWSRSSGVATSSRRLTHPAQEPTWVRAAAAAARLARLARRVRPLGRLTWTMRRLAGCSEPTSARWTRGWRKRCRVRCRGTWRRRLWRAPPPRGMRAAGARRRRRRCRRARAQRHGRGLAAGCVMLGREARRRFGAGGRSGRGAARVAPTRHSR